MTGTKSALLRGLQPQPLGSYLAALGLLRVCSEQMDPMLRGSWAADGFVLHGATADSLVAFLVDQYSPTPLVAPWAGGSGFSEGEDATAVDMIRASSTPRLARYRDVIERVLGFPELPPRGLRVRDVSNWAETIVQDEGQPKKLRADLRRLHEELAGTGVSVDAAVDDLRQGHAAAKIFTQMKAQRRVSGKGKLAARCRNELPDECLGWIDAALVLRIDERGEIDGIVGPLSKDAMKNRLEFSRLFMRSVCEVVLGTDEAQTARLARSLLTGDAVAGLSRTPAGLFELGSAGGANMAAGFEGTDHPNNPWKIAMVFEGCVFWSGSVSRRAGSARQDIATAAPFTTRHVAGGVGTTGHADRENSLAEVWAPVWRRGATASELASLFSEGRARIGGREPRNAIEFAEAVSTLGVDRGITSFVRYALVERRGPAYVAAPSGTLDVSERRDVDLLKQLDGELAILDRFLRAFKGEGPPAYLVSRRRAIDDARFDVAQRGGPDAMRALVRAIGALELILARRDPGREPQLWRPLGGLGPDWVDACGDSVEVRIAGALSSLQAAGGAGALRTYLAPLDREDPRRYAPAPRPLAWIGFDLADRLANVLDRRLLDARRGSSDRMEERRNPTWGARRVSLSDVAVFLEGNLHDHAALEELVFGFTWVASRTGEFHRASRAASPLPRVYALLKLLFLPHALPRGDDRINVQPDPAILALLRAGRLDDAVEIGRRQLRAKGLRPRQVVGPGVQDTAFARRLAAALLIPVTGTRELMALALLPDDPAANSAPITANPENQETVDVH